MVKAPVVVTVFPVRISKATVIADASSAVGPGALLIVIGFGSVMLAPIWDCCAAQVEPIRGPRWSGIRAPPDW